LSSGIRGIACQRKSLTEGLVDLSIQGCLDVTDTGVDSVPEILSTSSQ
jgi:hypothetical protein